MLVSYLSVAVLAFAGGIAIRFFGYYELIAGYIALSPEMQTQPNVISFAQMFGLFLLVLCSLMLLSSAGLRLIPKLKQFSRMILNLIILVWIDATFISGFALQIFGNLFIAIIFCIVVNYMLLWSLVRSQHNHATKAS